MPHGSICSRYELVNAMAQNRLELPLMVKGRAQRAAWLSLRTHKPDRGWTATRQLC